jgi:hypothetical protein
LDLIKTDKRLHLELNWVDKISFYSISGASSFLIFDGSTLLNEFGNHIVQINAENSKRFLEELVQCSGNKEVYFFKSKRQEEQKRLLDEKDFCEAEEGLLKSCGLDNDSFMDRLLTRFFSRQLTSLFLKTSFTPNQITFISLFIGLASALCFLDGGYQMGIAGSVLLILSAWVDFTDGEVARLKFLTSE